MDAERRKQLLESSVLGRAVAKRDPALFAGTRSVPAGGASGDAGGPFAQQLRAALAGNPMNRVRVVAAAVQGAANRFLSTPGGLPVDEAPAAADLRAVLADALKVLDEAAG